MKDFIDNEVQVGDEVVFILPNYSELQRGTIVKLTPKGVSVMKINSTKKTHRYPNQFVKIQK